MNDFLNTNYSPYLWIVFLVLTIFSIFMTTIFRKDKKEKNKANLKDLTLNIIEYLSLFIVFGIFCINTNILNIAKANFVFGISLFFYIIHFELLVKYLVGGKEEELLYKPFMYIKVPISLSLSLGVIFLSIWSKSIFAIIFSIIFGIVYVYKSYVYYKEKYLEYRELLDENRKYTGKKILKDGKIPKGLNIVTVVVFMYNPKNNKWVMQKRSKSKGGKWATTSGHPKVGESSIVGMMTEIKEEIGFDIKESELEFITTHKRKNKFVDIYYLEKNIDLDEAILQQEEVSDIKYLSDREVEKFYEAGKFKKTHYEYFKILKDKIKENKGGTLHK